MYRLILFFILAGWLFTAAQAETRSSSLYTEVEQSIYQIQVLNKKTGNKSTIGSAFVVVRDDILATNYHVISDYVSDPGTFSVEYFSTSGETGALELLGVDVLHDLAVLQAKMPLGKPLEIDIVPEKGAALYSLGNPMDLGFSIVNGTNNGILSNSEENNILFSGSLNPGMSGGPTLNDAGKVVGVNVATAGDDVSFLVSAQYLEILLERIKLRDFKPSDNLHGDITYQVSSNSADMLERLINNEWNTTRIGHFDVPAAMGYSINCWDDSSEPEERGLVRVYSTHCSNELEIYLDKKLNVGGMKYQYTWYESNDMIPPHFYRAYESQNNTGLMVGFDKKNVTKFECRTHFVNLSGKDFKMTVCKRNYRRYQGLSDVLVTGAMVGGEKQGMLFDLYLTGADFDSVMRLLERMLGEFKWHP